ncbi:MAG: nitroreductase [Myxococcota bacterium]|nr:nitroreductase [Myxococcota bacterium]
MDAMELLRTRASNGKLEAPAPDDATLAEILEAALRAPDHAALRPWKILTIRGEARDALGEVFAEAAKAREPELDDEKLARTRRKPLRAPLLLVVAAVPVEHPKAPEIEQVLSAGAVAHGILLGLQAKGFAGMWRTGAPAYDDAVKAALGLRPEDHIVGFVYVGTASVPAPDMPRPSVDAYVVPWHGR